MTNEKADNGMHLEVEVKVPRPTGKWEIMKWNVLKGETEADAEVIKQDNLITDAAIKSAVFACPPSNVPSNRTVLGYCAYTEESKLCLSTDATVPYATVAPTYVAGNFIEANFNPYNANPAAGSAYFMPTGATGSNVGKVVQSLRAYAQVEVSPATHHLGAWLKLASPITIAEGDVLKVNYSFSAQATSVTTTGTVNLTTFAYGKDPEVPGDGVAAGSFDWEAVLSKAGGNFLFNLPRDAGRTVVTNGDGSLSCVETYTYTSAIKPVNGSAGDVPPINLTKSSVSLGTLSFTGATKPQWTPGSYYTITVAVTMTVAAA